MKTLGEHYGLRAQLISFMSSWTTKKWKKRFLKNFKDSLTVSCIWKLSTYSFLWSLWPTFASFAGVCVCVSHWMYHGMHGMGDYFLKHGLVFSSNTTKKMIRFEPSFATTTSGAGVGPAEPLPYLWGSEPNRVWIVQVTTAAVSLWV